MTVRQWIGEELASDKTREIGLCFHNFIMKYHEITSEIYDSLSDRTKEVIYTLAYHALYVSYDINQPFLPQQAKIYDAFLEYLDVHISTIKKSRAGNKENRSLLMEFLPPVMKLHDLISTKAHIGSIQDLVAMILGDES